MRLDLELVNRNLFESRNKAQNAIKTGSVYVNSKKITQCSIEVNENDSIEIKNRLKYVSKGGLKLEKILKETTLSLKEKVLVDIGSSTGGFTDCAIQNGIKKVYAVDVGKDQLHHSLRNNPKIIVYEETDFRNIEETLINDGNIASIDVSFISSVKMLDKIIKTNIEEILLLIKPQFECGKEIADRYKGVILNKKIHFDVIKEVLNKFQINDFYCNYLTNSPIQGGNGNIEYIAYLAKNNTHQNVNDDYIKNLINQTFKSFNVKSK